VTGPEWMMGAGRFPLSAVHPHGKLSPAPETRILATRPGPPLTGPPSGLQTLTSLLRRKMSGVGERIWGNRPWSQGPKGALPWRLFLGRDLPPPMAHQQTDVQTLLDLYLLLGGVAGAVGGGGQKEGKTYLITAQP
jgi:hypothetical protein